MLSAILYSHYTHMPCCCTLLGLSDCSYSIIPLLPYLQPFDHLWRHFPSYSSPACQPPVVSSFHSPVTFVWLLGEVLRFKSIIVVAIVGPSPLWRYADVTLTKSWFPLQPLLLLFPLLASFFFLPCSCSSNTFWARLGRSTSLCIFALSSSALTPFSSF